MLQTKYKTLTYNLQSADFVELKITVLIVIQFHVYMQYISIKKQ